MSQVTAVLPQSSSTRHSYSFETPRKHPADKEEEFKCLSERARIRTQISKTPSQETKMTNNKKIGKVRYLFGGRFLFGPDMRLALVALLMISIPSVIYDGWTLPWIVDKWPAGWILAVVSVILECGVLGLFLRTALSDPGIVPRENDLSGALWLDQIVPKNPPKHQDVVIHGHLFKMKYCLSCNFYRPPRCVHCSTCDNCVDKFDHHCPWVGNCVGRRNYRSFLLFITTTSLFILVVLVTCPVKFVHCIQEETRESDVKGAFAHVWPRAWDSVILTIFSFGILWFVVGLAGYHCFLLSSNQTTYEQIKGFYEDKLNPWDRGLPRNLRELLCRRRRPKFTFRARLPNVYSKMTPVEACRATGRLELGGVYRTALPLNAACVSSSTHSLSNTLATSSLERAPPKVIRLSGQHAAAFDAESISLSPDATLESARTIIAPPQHHREDHHWEETAAVCLKCKGADCCCRQNSEIFFNRKVDNESLTTTFIPGEPHRDSTLLAWLKKAGEIGKMVSRTDLGRWTCVLPED